MKIAIKKVIGMHYTLTNSSGEELDSSVGKEPLYYLHGFGNIVSGLEEALLGKRKGDKISVSIPPEKGYGVLDDKNMLQVEKKQFEGAENIKVGMEIQTQGKKGLQLFVVSKIFGETIILDGNHPLAGETLNFEVEILEARNASHQELEHVHVHGSGGHHH